MARRFKHEDGIDFLHTFAPIVWWSIIRCVIAIATRKHWKLQHLDVKTTFLNGKITTKVYMTIPLGFEELSENYILHGICLIISL